VTDSLFSDLIWLSDENGTPVDFGAPYALSTLASDILPSSSGAFERALAFAASDNLPVPFAQIMDPATSPKRFLPFLAAHESVDLWWDNWSDERKRRMIAEAPALAALKGTLAAADRFLPYVDAEIVHRMSYPRRFVVGRAVLGQTPIGHKSHTSHLLIKLPLHRPAHCFIIGRSALGRAALRTLDREPIRRANRALTVAKSPETLVTANYGWRRPITLDDGFPLDGSWKLGGYVDRKRI